MAPIIAAGMGVTGEILDTIGQTRISPPRIPPRFFPWLDRAGKLSPLKLSVFVMLFLPGLWVGIAYAENALGARPLNAAIHQIGLWTIRLVFFALAVTPARQIFNWPKLLLIRRMIGVAAFAYAAIHLSLYTADQKFDLAKVASEIALRVYLTIGFAALLGLLVLAATSTDKMIRRLGGPRWRRLHQLAYPIGILAIIHFSMQSKLDQTEPIVMAGLFLWLMVFRLPRQVTGRGMPELWRLFLFALAATAVTALGEAIYFQIATGAPVSLVLAANLDTESGVRPAWIVGGITFGVTIIAALHRALRPARRLRTA